MSYDNSLTGILTKNDRRTKDTHPEYRGSITMEDGREYWLSAWIKTGKEGGKLAGQKFFSLALEPKDGQVAKPRPGAGSSVPQTSIDDDIPF